MILKDIYMIKSKSYGHPAFWLAPAVLMLLLFYLYPILDIIRLSFTNASILKPDYQYTFSSYIKTFRDSDFFHTIWVSILFVFSNVVGQLGLGLIIALALHEGSKRKLKGTILVRTIVLAAWMIPGVLVGIVWQMLLSSSQFGIMNYLLESMGFERIKFLVQPNYALLSIIIANIWRGTAFSMILLYAGLQKIPEGLYDAASIDGASTVQKFLFITIPQLLPILFINLVLITINTFNTFDMIVVLTGGGPARATQVLTLSSYEQVFSFFNLGRGAAIAVILLFFNLVMAVSYYKLLLKKED